MGVGLTDFKPADYYASDRSDLLDWVGGRHRRVLDVGCASGANAQWYRQHGTVELVGVEINAASAARARQVFDRVLHMPVDDAIGDLVGPFDLIVCADVLEHLVDPWTTVRQLRDLAHPSTVLALSMPNIRFAPALVRIALGRGFEYEERGIFDSTHLRFFVRRNIDQLVRQGGWTPVRWGAPPFGRLGTVWRALQRVSGGRSDQWLARQLFVTAEPTTST